MHSRDNHASFRDNMDLIESGTAPMSIRIRKRDGSETNLSQGSQMLGQDHEQTQIRAQEVEEEEEEELKV